MGYMNHHALIVTGWEQGGDRPTPWIVRMEDLIEQMPEEVARTVLRSQPLTNGYVTFVMVPDGSKEGWDTSDEAEKWRGEVLAAFTPHNGNDESGVYWADAALVEFGGDAPDVTSLRTNDEF